MTSTPSKVRRAQARKHEREREPERALDIIVAELLALDEPMSRQHLSGDHLHTVAADILWHWQADIGGRGYPNGLAGYIAGYYLARIDPLDSEASGRAWRDHLATLETVAQLSCGHRTTTTGTLSTGEACYCQPCDADRQAVSVTYDW